jgi:hypothetical protein
MHGGQGGAMRTPFRVPSAKGLGNDSETSSQDIRMPGVRRSPPPQ